MHNSPHDNIWVKLFKTVSLMLGHWFLILGLIGDSGIAFIFIAPYVFLALLPLTSIIAFFWIKDRKVVRFSWSILVPILSIAFVPTVFYMIEAFGDTFLGELP